MTHITVQVDHSSLYTGPSVQPRDGLTEGDPQLQEMRRRQMRFPTRGLRTHSPVFGRAVEVSGGGLRLESATRLVAHGRYVFRLNYGARFLNLPGRVAWSRLHRIEITERGRHAIYHAGIELDPGESAPRWRAALVDRAGVAVGV